MKQKIFVGSLLIAAGIVILLFNLGLVAFSSAVTAYWPIGLVLIGISLMYKQKALAGLLAIATIIFAVAHGLGSIDLSTDTREYVQKLDPGEVTGMDLELSYGAGSIAVGKGTPLNLVKNTVVTGDRDEPFLESDIYGAEADVRISRHGETFWIHQKDSWDVELSPEPSINLDMDYGAADADIDLSGLKVDSLSIETGASSTVLRFGRYPTSAEIDLGAGSMALEFPEGYPARIIIDSGLSSINFDGFTKSGDVYKNEYYKEGEPAIEIMVDAGASSLEGDYYG